MADPASSSRASAPHPALDAGALEVPIRALEADGWRGSDAALMTCLRGALRTAEILSPEASDTDREAAARLLADAAVASSQLGLVRQGAFLARRAIAIAAGTSDAAVAIARRTVAWQAALTGAVWPEDEPFDPRRHGALPRLHRLHASRGEVATWEEDPSHATAELDAAVAEARDAPDLRDAPVVLALHADLSVRLGDGAAARARAEQAARLGSEHGVAAHRAAIVLARLDAERGEDARATRALRSEIEATGGLLRLHALAAKGFLALSCAPAPAAAETLEQLHRTAAELGVTGAGVLGYLPDIVEAQVRAGRRREAHRSLQALAAATTVHDRPRTTAGAWRSLGLLAADGDVDHAFEQGHRHAAASAAPFEQARVALCHGERLLAGGRRAEGRAQLQASLDGFEALGAGPWRERAASELRAAGIRPARPEATRLDPLTPQEESVAGLVADGFANREIAEQLDISIKTVEYHLTRVYRKTGVRSRTQLASSALAQETPDNGGRGPGFPRSPRARPDGRTAAEPTPVAPRGGLARARGRRPPAPTTNQEPAMPTTQVQLAVRKLIVTDPPMEGPDVKALQLAVKRRLKATGLADEVPVAKHGKFTEATWDAFIEAAYTLGLREDAYLTKDGGRGVATKGAQKFVLNPTERTAVQKARAQERKKHDGPRYLGLGDAAGNVAPPLAKIKQSSWGWHGTQSHDGVDLICDPAATLFAICDAEVVDVRDGGWWGKGAPSDPSVKARGDGIIQLRCLVDAGPFRKGMHFGYGHAEQAVVKVGQVVKAGQKIGQAGLAREWHTHFMVNGGGTPKGVGDRDPMPFVLYAIAKGQG